MLGKKLYFIYLPVLSNKALQQQYNNLNFRVISEKNCTMAPVIFIEFKKSDYFYFLQIRYRCRHIKHDQFQPPVTCHRYRTLPYRYLYVAYA